jgi:hypothetical protein
MTLKVQRVDTWAASIDDKPGGLAAKLNALTGAGVNLEMMISRRTPEKPGWGVVFVAPVEGAAQTRVAREVGFEISRSMNSVRVEGPNRPGHALNIIEALAANRISLRGFTAAAIGKKFVGYVALDTPADAAKAVRILRKSAG